MSKNKYKNNEPLNRKVSTEETGEDREIILESEVPEEAAQVEAGDGKVNLRPADIKDSQSEEEPQSEGTPPMDITPGGASAPPDFRANPLDLDSENPKPGEPPTYFDEVHIPKENKDSGEPKRDTRVTPGDRKSNTSGGFPWWWILLPLILLALIYGLTRKPTPPVNQQTESRVTYQKIVSLGDNSFSYISGG